MKLIVFAVAVASVVNSDLSRADTFGSGSNAFNIEFLTIGNPGNVADTTGNPNPAGSVPYTYRMGKFEISEQMINKANALGGLGITKDTRSADKPATSMNWNEAARFVNWLNTSTGRPPAYKFALQPGEVGYSPNDNIQLWMPSDAGYNPNNLYRNSLARYFLPSVEEWYKAAYFDPKSGAYYEYPTGSNSVPTPVAGGTTADTVVYLQPTAQGPADVTLAGGLSPYGTMGQGGNVYEYEETEFDLINDSSSSLRSVRGGDWDDPTFRFMLRAIRENFLPPTVETSVIGLRVASTPEPSALFLAFAGFGLLAIRRR
jgi:hypothetical protein